MSFLRYYFDLEEDGSIDTFLKEIPPEELESVIEQAHGLELKGGYTSNFLQTDYEGKIHISPKLAIVERVAERSKFDRLGDLKGITLCSKLDFESGDEVIYVDKWEVLRQYQGKGTGKNMLDYVLRASMDFSIDKVFLRAYNGNADAIRSLSGPAQIPLFMEKGEFYTYFLSEALVNKPELAKMCCDYANLKPSDFQNRDPRESKSPVGYLPPPS